MKLKGLVLMAFLSLQSMALDMGDIEIMCQSGVKIAFPSERKAHDVSCSSRPADLMRVNYLKLNGQSLRKIPSWLPKMTNLVKLELEDTHMDLVDLFVLKTLTKLNTLNLSDNRKLFDKGGKLSELLSHFSLSELYLANTGGSSSDYANIGESNSLIKLDLSENSISSINTLHLEKLRNLKSLKLVGNSISGTLDTAYLPKHSLVYLNLSSNNISRLKYSDDFPVLESLHIANNRSYLEFDEDWDDAYGLKNLSDGSFNKDVALPRSIMKRLGIKSKWITPSNSVCRANKGTAVSDYCYANWERAKKICSASGGELPSIDELRKVVRDCGGTNVTYGDKNYEAIKDKNRYNNESYLKCHEAKGFSRVRYWSATTNVSVSSNALTVLFFSGSNDWESKTDHNSIRCVRGGQ